MTSPTPEALYKQLLYICNFLERTNIAYIVVGGIAVSIWVAPRATVDLDFVIGLNEEDLPSFIEKAKREGLIIFDPKPMQFRRMKLFRMFLQGKEAELLMLDFILTDSDFFRESLKRAVTIPLEGTDIKVASPEDLILLKLLSGRGQDMVDAENIIRMRRDALDRNYLKSWSERLFVIDLLNQLWPD